MKKLFLLFLLSLNIFALEKLNINDSSLSDDSQALLESISNYAIKVGNGSFCKTYIFIDPMCPYSQKYIQQITKNKKAQEVNSYYIFLYKLPKFNSNKLLQHIYQSSNPVETLKKVMIKHQDVNLDEVVIDADIQTKINSIASVASSLKITVRPYVMAFQKGSKYCTVSSGPAPCLEENDF
ncbi:hypothetical protein GJV85_08815 [Sulfurimonas aquatica]|uniref:Thioredoxin-like fold domain-containing protein n=1 Tax=Sulfurimonas aquatica TaxID=2672570 RepID=A0A975B0Z1_9BACT|nr:hypothetical protein [Sulfurimonas aquatica]QSZ42209.1 hypothetical protein GJV85_08815 [Sulfurimonas aquatica]